MITLCLQSSQMHCSFWVVPFIASLFHLAWSRPMISTMKHFTLHMQMFWWFRVFVLKQYKSRPVVSVVSLTCLVHYLCCSTDLFYFPSESFLQFFISSTEILAPGGLVLSNLTERVCKNVHAKSIIKLIQHFESATGDTDTQTAGRRESNSSKVIP